MNQQPRKNWLRIAMKLIHTKGRWKVIDRKKLLTICAVPSSTASAEIAALSEVHGFKEKKQTINTQVYFQIFKLLSHIAWKTNIVFVLQYYTLGFCGLLM